MNPQEPNQAAQQPASHNSLSSMQPGERVICEIKRHPIGMLVTYIISGIILVTLAVLTLIIIPNLIGGDKRGLAMVVGGLLFFAFAALVLIFVYIDNVVYWGNRWIVTSNNITQITQTSLFKKQAGQISLASLEDVTAEQNGMPADLLNYGTLRIETAGERNKFIFQYCPSPNYYAQKILAARTVFEHGNNENQHQPIEQLQQPTADYTMPQPQPSDDLPPETGSFPAAYSNEQDYLTYTDTDQ